MKTFTLYSPHRKQYLGTEYRSRWVDWAKEAREFPSLQEAKDHIFWQDWQDSTDATNPLAVYAVELIG